MRYGEITKSIGLDGELSDSIRMIEDDLSQGDRRSEGRTYLIVSIVRGDSLALGNTIIEIDRELRRTVSFAEKDRLTPAKVVEKLDFSRKHSLYWEQPSRGSNRNEDVSASSSDQRSKGRVTRPIEATRGSTRLVAFEPGSGHLLFDVVGAAMETLTTMPLSAVLNLAALVQGARWAGARVLVFRDRRAQFDPQEMLRGAAKNGGDLQGVIGQPERVVDLGRVDDASRITSRISSVHETMDPTGVVTERTTVTIEAFS